MKLNKVIILTCRQLNEFFSFSEFWEKKKEFKDLSSRKGFFKSENSYQTDYRIQVCNWISGIPLTSDKHLEETNIILPHKVYSRVYTKGCEEELKIMTKEEAYGVVSLYEMMGRKLKEDIYEVLACLGYEVLNPNSGIIIVKSNKSYNLEQYLPEKNDSQEKKLRNVLIANLSDENDGPSIVSLGNESIHIKPGECTRGIFYGNMCLKLLPCMPRMKFELDKEKMRTGLSLDGNTISVKGEAISFSCGKNGYVYTTVGSEKKFVASHRNIGDYFFNNPIAKDENIIYVEMNESEDLCLMLTDLNKLYTCDKNDNITLNQSNVLFASFVNGKIQSINL